MKEEEKKINKNETNEMKIEMAYRHGISEIGS
jgi:hypothetical protein